MGDWDFLYDMNARGSSSEEILNAMATGFDSFESDYRPKRVIAFLDFEFGSIYGSWRRDFLITEAAVLIYDTENNNLRLGEVVFSPDINLVARVRTKVREDKYKTLEYVVNRHKDEAFKYDENFKLSTKERKTIRQVWNKKYINRLKTFFSNTLKDIDDIYVFGGNEDINLLNRYNIKYNNIIDIQTLLHKGNKKQYSIDIQEKLEIEKYKRYSLDLLIDKLEFKNIIDNNQIKFSGPFKNLCQSGKITNTQGHRNEYRNRCRAVCS